MTQRSDTILPIYFPFTFIQESIAGILHDIFGGAIVYQPNFLTIDSKILQYLQKNQIEVRPPAMGDEAILNDLIKKYNAFGSLHGDELKTFTQTAPDDSNDESFITQIRSKIIENENNAHLERDELLSARLFLQMAQNFDMQQYEIDHELELSEEKNRRMFSDLTGLSRADNIVEKKLSVYDYGDYQTRARIDSWAKLYSNDDNPCPFLITDSRVCLDQIFSILPSRHLLYSWDGAPCFKDEPHRQPWINLLNRFTQTSWKSHDVKEFKSFAAVGADKYCLQLYLFPDTPPAKLVDAILNQKAPTRGIKTKYNNTLIGFLEMKI